jgi:membrane protein implicated in regulation of membrane protease activity
MNPMLKYTLGRLGIFVAFALPAMYLLTSLDPLVRLMVALVVSAVVSYFALRRWRDEVSQRIAESARRRTEHRERLRSALAGETSNGAGGGDDSGADVRARNERGGGSQLGTDER